MPMEIFFSYSAIFLSHTLSIQYDLLIQSQPKAKVLDGLTPT